MTGKSNCLGLSRQILINHYMEYTDHFWAQNQHLQHFFLVCLVNVFSEIMSYSRF